MTKRIGACWSSSLLAARPSASRGLAVAGRPRADCEDIVQETLLAMHLKRDTWDETQPLQPWLRAIAHHKLVDHRRRRGFPDHVDIDDHAETLAGAGGGGGGERRCAADVGQACPTASGGSWKEHLHRGAECPGRRRPLGHERGRRARYASIAPCGRWPMPIARQRS